jgi:hypothetical protein
MLAHFPGPLVLPAGRGRAVFTVVGSLACVALAIVLLAYIEQAVNQPSVWAALVGFSVFALGGIVMLFPGAGSLILAADGLTVCHLFRKTHTSWRQASNFAIGRTGTPGVRFVCFDDAGRSGLTAAVNRDLVNRNAALNDTYGLTHEELVQLLADWQSRALCEMTLQPGWREKA